MIIALYASVCRIEDLRFRFLFSVSNSYLSHPFSFMRVHAYLFNCAVAIKCFESIRRRIHPQSISLLRFQRWFLLVLFQSNNTVSRSSFSGLNVG